MKFTLKQIKQIITEEVETLLSEALTSAERWAGKGDIKLSPTGIPELKDEILNSPGMAFVHIVERYFADKAEGKPSLEQLEDFDKEHVMAMVTGLRDGTIESLIDSFEVESREAAENAGEYEKENRKEYTLIDSRKI